MKHMLIGCLCLFATAWAQAADPAISLVVVGDLDPAMAERVRAFAQENLALPVRLLEPREAAAASSLNEIGDAAAEAMGPEDTCLVVLAVPTEDLPNHGVRLQEKNSAVVNARLLKPAGGDEEQYGRRLDREVMMSIGLLMGLETCPNPQCAMWLYSNDEELDMKGRNYCPPCLERIQKLAVERGLKIVADSPFAPIPDEPVPEEAASEPAAPEQAAPAEAGEPEPIAETP
ncbi:MAG TPA: hypothetical protein P5567_08510 [Kiritimatiellia bacterium]|nr:hypothetical protein [Kiritimatiellia bacterium]HRZ12483.1 hypothetical protein [Kiritimatiellia bacterium]HSA17759.1 hypothetical protein [Kiritimatiellia bacterium]